MVKFDRYKDGKRYALTFSYDDGCDGDRRLAEMFTKYGMKATFNIHTKPFDSTSKDGIQLNELRSLFIDKGHEVACHAYSHPHLEHMPIGDQYDELIRDRRTLEAATGTIVRGLAYPFGTYNDDTFTAMKTASLVYGRTVASTGSFAMPDNFLLWHPTAHHNQCERHVDQLIHNVEKAPWRAGGLLYIWGHAYEFNNPDLPVGWDKFEEILAKLQPKLYDIWCATNIEIYDYIQAKKMLRRSADGKTFYNPTDIDVWASNDDAPFCIGACQTVTVDS